MEEKKQKKAQTAKDEEESKEMTLESSLAVREENDVRIAVIGNVDSGKSTLVGVLTKGIMDDGRGKARAKVFNFDHE
jgi:GTPase